MKSQKNKLVLLKRDYDLLLKYIFSRMSPMSGESKNAEQLYEELADAEILEKEEDFPANVIRLNSLVKVEEINTGRKMSFRLVMPAQANLSKGKLSVFAPLGVVLIGYRKGQQVSWEMPAGRKVFYIADVSNAGLLV